jgi:hypothetical protein
MKRSEYLALPNGTKLISILSQNEYVKHSKDFVLYGEDHISVNLSKKPDVFVSISALTLKD